MDFKAYIKDVADFPKPGITFRDITPLLADATAWAKSIQALAQTIAPWQPDFIVGIESRGFILAAPVAYTLGVGLVLVRKSGKLPRSVYRQAYALEYGSDSLEIHQDSFSAQPGRRVVLLDDVIATGGTAYAATQLVTQAGGLMVGCCFLIELDFLEGRNQLAHPVTSLVHY